MEKNDSRKRLNDKLQEIILRGQPLGFNKICNDLDIEVLEYDMYIGGIVKTYLKKNRFPLTVTKIDRKEELGNKLFECRKKLEELQVLYDLNQELIDIIYDCLEQDSI